MLSHLLSCAILFAPTLAAQTPQIPQTKIQRGFASLSQGSWSHALAEWNQDGMLADEKLEETRAALEKLAPQPRTIGEWGPLHAPVLQRLWQRHWLLAGFDRGALFVAIDYIWHKGEWRLLKVTPTLEPRDLLPNLDAPATVRERN
jgi:hypothetical protein